MAKRKKLRGKELEEYARAQARKDIPAKMRREQILNYVYTGLTRFPGQTICKEALRKRLFLED